MGNHRSKIDNVNDDFFKTNSMKEYEQFANLMQICIGPVFYAFMSNAVSFKCCSSNVYSYIKSWMEYILSKFFPLVGLTMEVIGKHFD
jgi:hypothetical protein